jgi:LmbE family N-acetylglucosaminyl deacetylase
MIVPRVKENDWLRILERLPVWQPTGNPVVIVSPHPDDETLGAGGFIAFQQSRGIDVTVAAVTDGENAYPDHPALGNLRRLEQEQALACLGVPKEKIFRFKLPDGAVESRQAELSEHLSGLVSNHTHVMAPWKGDFHPDHRACGRASEEVAGLKGAILTSYFFWTWHFADREVLGDLNVRRFPLDNGWLRAKSRALIEHQSQLIRSGGEPILPERLLAPARRPFEVFAVA